MNFNFAENNFFEGPKRSEHNATVTTNGPRPFVFLESEKIGIAERKYKSERVDLSYAALSRRRCDTHVKRAAEGRINR